MRVLIIGCGYVGVPLGRRLVELGHAVWGLRRSASAEEELRAAGIQPVHADITRREELEGLPRDYDWVVNLVSSGRGWVEDYERIYLAGTRILVDWLGGSLKKFVYASSTSVYGQTGGERVNESSLAEPRSATSRVLVETEALLQRAWREQGFPAVVLRLAGIYGPGRGHLFKRFLRGEAEMVGEGERLLNMIHLEDVVGIMLAALERARPGEILNAVDDEPVPERAFYEWLAEQTGRELPPSRRAEEFEGRKRGLTNKRVLNARLKEALGYEFRHPTYREGYARELAGVVDKK